MLHKKATLEDYEGQLWEIPKLYNDKCYWKYEDYENNRTNTHY